MPGMATPEPNVVFSVANFTRPAACFSRRSAVGVTIRRVGVSGGAERGARAIGFLDEPFAPAIHLVFASVAGDHRAAGLFDRGDVFACAGGAIKHNPGRDFAKIAGAGVGPSISCSGVFVGVHPACAATCLGDPEPVAGGCGVQRFLRFF